MSLMVMEFPGQHEIMRKALVARRRFPRVVDHISTFLVNSLFFTSDWYLPGEKKKELAATYVSPHLNKLQEDFVYKSAHPEPPLLGYQKRVGILRHTDGRPPAAVAGCLLDKRRECRPPGPVIL